MWGRKGMGPGEFDMPHAIDLDSQGRVFVADRQNNRVQVFDSDGNFEAVWYQFGRPSALYIDENDVLYVADSESRDGRTNTGRRALPSSVYGYNAGAARGRFDWGKYVKGAGSLFKHGGVSLMECVVPWIKV